MHGFEVFFISPIYIYDSVNKGTINKNYQPGHTFFFSFLFIGTAGSVKR